MLVGSHAAAAATTLPIKVMTYNTHHGGTATTPATTQSQLDTIAAENPDVVVLQEAYYNQLATYVNGLNAARTRPRGTAATTDLQAGHRAELHDATRARA